MKRVLTLAVTQGVSSLLSILMWFIVALVYGNSDLSNIFMITYPFQIVWNLLYYSIIAGSLIWENKHKSSDRNISSTAIIISTLLFLITVAVVIFNNESFFLYYSLGPDVYINFFIFSLLCLTINMFIGGLVYQLQFREQENIGVKIMMSFYSLQVISISLIGFSGLKEFHCIFLSILILTIYCIIVAKKYFKISKLDLHVFKGCKYRIIPIIGNISMCLVYFLGIKSVYEMGLLYVVTYNLQALSTDTQWDVLGVSSETDAALHICEGTFLANRKVIYTNYLLVGTGLLLSSVLMMFIGSFFYTIDLKYIVGITVMELILFPLYGIQNGYRTYISINHPSKKLGIIHATGHLFRVVISIGIASPYAVSMGVGVQSVICTGGLYILYRWHLRQEINEGSLNLK